MKRTVHLRKNEITFVYLYAVAMLFASIVLVLSRVEKISRHGIISQRQEERKEIIPLVFSFKEKATPYIEAEAYVVYDVIDKKVIFSKNQDKKLSLASITKIMTAVTALEIASSTRTVSIQRSPIQESYDKGLVYGQAFTLPEIIKYMLVISSNDASDAIANAFMDKHHFVEKMNEVAKREHMETLAFNNVSGLDFETYSGARGTATDVAKLMAYAYKKMPTVLEATTKESISVFSSYGNVSYVENTNKDIEKYNGMLGSKTGYTEEAGGNLAVIFDGAFGRPVVIAVLGSSRAGRFRDVDALYDMTKKAIQ